MLRDAFESNFLKKILGPKIAHAKAKGSTKRVLVVV